MSSALSVLLLASRLTGAEACTALAVDGAATVNGAAFAVENTDCDNCDFRLTYIDAQDHQEDAQRPIYLQKAAYPRFVGYGRGEIYHPVGDQEAFKPAVFIPQVKHTYGYYESACPLMNDQGLGIGESSCAAMLLNRAPNAPEDNRSVPVGYLDAAALMQLVLERCASAKCGAALMGELVEAYGYLPFFGEPTLGKVPRTGKSEWDDAGEAYTLADASGEAWVVHVLGGVSGAIRSVWVAQRVPKGHVAPVANTYTIGYLPDEPNEDFLFNKDIFRAARVAGLWDGEGQLHFSRAFGPDVMTEAAPEGSVPIPMYTSLRKWRLLNLAAPSANLQLEIDSQRMPFSIKADHKLTRRDIMAMMGDHYAGTEFDMTKGMLAGPWGTPFRAEGGPKFGQVPRGISIMRSIYSAISESGPEGARVWFGFDTAETTVYTPLDHRTDALIPAMHTGTYTHFTRDSMFWAFDYVANWMQLNYGRMSEEDVRPRQQAWQDFFDREISANEKKGFSKKEWGDWQLDVQQRVLSDWWRLADSLVVKWNDYERTADGTIGSAWAYPVEWSRMIGTTTDVHPIWVQPAAEPVPPPPGYVPSTVSLPRRWDVQAKEWRDWTVPAAMQLDAAMGTQSLVVGAALFVMGSLGGFAAGRRKGPAKQREGAQEPLLA